MGLHGSNLLMIPSASTAAGAMGRGLLATCPSHDWCTWLFAMKFCLCLLSSHHDSFIMFCNASCHTIRIHAAWSKCCLIYKLKLTLIKQLSWLLDLYAISNQQHSTIILSLLMLTFTCIYHFRYPSPCQGLSNPKWLLSKSRASKPWPSKLTKPP